MVDDLKLIKKYYGEGMMHLCRDLFPTILETPGLLFSLIDSRFQRSKFLYEDIINQGKQGEFKDFIFRLTKKEKNGEIKTNKEPFELMKEAGYTLYECNSEEEIQSFKKYYQKGEVLCTFNGGRLKDHYVFFAVKDNLDEIKRENFPNPQRQDEYGTSVISIQFSKGEFNNLSIKNRYNHKVPNCDATFSNNLENIIPGLTDSFTNYFNLNITQNEKNAFELDGYVFADDKKYYKYNYEMNGIYYCQDNIIIRDGDVITLYNEKERFIFLDYFILDLKEKEFELYDRRIRDSFFDTLECIHDKIEKINITKVNTNKIITIILNNNEEVIIEIDKYNRIIKYKNDIVKCIGNYFLQTNEVLESLTLNNVTEIGNYILEQNKNMKELNIPNIQKIGSRFAERNNKLKNFKALSLKEIGYDFLSENEVLNVIECPNLTKVGGWFLVNNKSLTSIDFPKLEECKNCFISNNEIISNVNLPLLKYAGDYFLSFNLGLKKISFPNLKIINDDFISNNQDITSVYLPLVTEIDSNFLKFNICIKELDMPNLEKVGDNFIFYNEIIEKINFPNIKCVGAYFLYNNNKLKSIIFPQLEVVRNYFLYKNKCLEYFYVPKIYESSNRCWLHYLEHLTPTKNKTLTLKK